MRVLFAPLRLPYSFGKYRFLNKKFQCMMLFSMDYQSATVIFFFVFSCSHNSITLLLNRTAIVTLALLDVWLWQCRISVLRIICQLYTILHQSLICGCCQFGCIKCSYTRLIVLKTIPSFDNFLFEVKWLDFSSVKNDHKSFIFNQSSPNYFM